MTALRDTLRHDNPRHQLLSYDPAKAQAVGTFKLSILPEAHPSINCFQALDYLCVPSLLSAYLCLPCCIVESDPAEI